VALTPGKRQQMSTQELLIQIKALPLKEQMELVEALQRSFSENLEIPKRRLPASELRGLLKTDGPAPTDEEIKESYTNY
jgi:hypothetical protein